MNIREKCITQFRQLFGCDPAYIIPAPGRVNLLGEHVDYNDGFVLPIAIDRATWLAFSPSQTPQTTLAAVDLSEEVTFTLQTLPTKTSAHGKPLSTWALYPRRDVVADTTKRRTLTSGEYNSRRADCEEATRILQKFAPGLKSLRDVDVKAFDQFALQLPERVHKRARHVVGEIERTKRAVLLLENGDIVKFGNLLNECHINLRDLYEVSIPELDVMVHVAQSLPGCYGARLTGAGFGGCTVNLVRVEMADEFAKQLSAGYQAETGLHPEIYICQAAHGASVA